MNKVILLILNLFCISNCFSQIDFYSLPIVNKDEDSIIDSKCKIFFVGEYHHKPFNFNIEFTFWKLLNDNNIYPKFNIREDGPSLGYLITKYLETGNDTILSVIESHKNNWEIYRKVREYYLKLPNDKKFTFVGIDIDRFHYQVHYAIRDILINPHNLCNNETDRCYSFDSLVKEIRTVNNPIEYGKTGLKEQLKFLLHLLDSPDSTLILNHIIENSEIFNKIISAYRLALESKRVFIDNENKEFKTKREWLMINNLYSLYQKDSLAVCIGRFGFFHIQLSKPTKKLNKYNDISMAAILNNDLRFPLTNKKINSNIIVYSYAFPKHYKFLKTNCNDVNSIFKSMPQNTLYFMDYNDKTFMTNLILFKSIKN